VRPVLVAERKATGATGAEEDRGDERNGEDGHQQRPAQVSVQTPDEDHETRGKGDPATAARREVQRRKENRERAEQESSRQARLHREHQADCEHDRDRCQDAERVRVADRFVEQVSFGGIERV